MRIWMIALIATISLPQLRSEQCRIACLWAGYDAGDFRNPHCRCIDLKSYEVMTETKRLSLGSGKRKLGSQTEHTYEPWRYSDY